MAKYMIYAPTEKSGWTCSSIPSRSASGGVVSATTISSATIISTKITPTTKRVLYHFSRKRKTCKSAKVIMPSNARGSVP